MPDRVKYLINWTQESNAVGGVESRYSLLARAFPNAKRISARALSESDSIQSMRNAVDTFLLNNTVPDDIVISDAGVGGRQPVPCKKVIIFGNPYHSLKLRYPAHYGGAHWEELLSAQLQDSKEAALRIANSKFSQIDAVSAGCPIDCIVHNGVDMDFWKPVGGPRDIVLWVGSHFKEDCNHYDLGQVFKGFRFPLKRVYKERPVSKEALRGLYQRSVALIQDFPIEGNSNVVLEALACDTPVIPRTTGLFLQEPIGKVGARVPKRISKLPALVEQVASLELNPRQFIIDKKLTHHDYYKRMREVISNV